MFGSCIDTWWRFLNLCEDAHSLRAFYLYLYQATNFTIFKEKLTYNFLLFIKFSISSVKKNHTLLILREFFFNYFHLVRSVRICTFNSPLFQYQMNILHFGIFFF